MTPIAGSLELNLHMPFSFKLWGYNTRNLLVSAHAGPTGIIPESNKCQAALRATAHSFVSERHNGLTGGNGEPYCAARQQRSAGCAEGEAAATANRCRRLAPPPTGCLEQTHHLCHLCCCSYSLNSGLAIFPAHLLFAPNAAICGDAELFPSRQWNGSNLFPHLRSVDLGQRWAASIFHFTAWQLHEATWPLRQAVLILPPLGNLHY